VTSENPKLLLPKTDFLNDISNQGPPKAKNKTGPTLNLYKN